MLEISEGRGFLGPVPSYACGWKWALPARHRSRLCCWQVTCLLQRNKHRAQKRWTENSTNASWPPQTYARFKTDARQGLVLTAKCFNGFQKRSKMFEAHQGFNKTGLFCNCVFSRMLLNCFHFLSFFTVQKDSVYLRCFWNTGMSQFTQVFPYFLSI